MGIDFDRSEAREPLDNESAYPLGRVLDKGDHHRFLYVNVHARSFAQDDEGVRIKRC